MLFTVNDSIYIVCNTLVNTTMSLRISTMILNTNFSREQPYPHKILLEANTQLLEHITEVFLSGINDVHCETQS